MTENQIKAKKYLHHIGNLPREIENKILEIEVMRAKAEGLGALRYDKVNVQTSPEDTMPDAVIKLIEFIERLEDDNKRLVMLRDRADSIMECLDDEQRATLDYYFLQHKNFNQISKRMGYSVRTIKRRYYDGLEMFGKSMSQYD